MVMAKIVNGPSKQQLIESFINNCSSSQTKVFFITEDKLKLIGSINSLSYQDGSGYLFAFGGYFNGGPHTNGYFNAKTREGWIEIKQRK